MHRPVVIALIVLLCAAASSAGTSAPDTRNAIPARPFVTGIFDPIVYGSPVRDIGLDLTKAAGATVVRLLINWRHVAPETFPAGFNPRDPADPNYRWDEIDGEVRRAVERGLDVILNIYDAPGWASEGYDGRNLGPINPNVSAFADFTFAAVTRFSGSFQGISRVRYWQVWNEPNLGLFLMPQRAGETDLSPDLYRPIVNAFAQVVHSVRPDNLVVAGGLAPFSSDVDVAIPPLRFMRELLCMSAGPRPRPTCNASVTFDVWTHHPYTSGGPNHKATNKDDVSLGNLPEMRALLDAAQRAGHVRSRGQTRFWVTEFSWDSRPPDPKGVPDARLARWIPEAFYRMWSSGVSLITWFKIRDEPFPDSFYQSGLYRWSGGTSTTYRAKLSQRAFRFPFVALKNGTAVEIWGRTPTSRAGSVIVERRVGARWVRALTLRANAFGIFAAKPAMATAKNTDVMRARFGREFAVPFRLGPTADIPVRPFGVFDPR
jgi:hypothetical protein